APLALMPGLGAFLFRPMALAVAFAMISAFGLSMSFVPTLCSLWLRARGPQPKVHQGQDYGHGNAHVPGQLRGPLGPAFARWESSINVFIGWYVRLLNIVIRRRLLTVASAVVLLLVVVVGLGSQLRREFFPEVDAGAFEVYVRAKSGTRIEETEKRVAEVEKFVRDRVGDDLELVISEIGVVADWSAAYTPNSGPMDAVVKVQLKQQRHRSAQEYVQRLRAGFAGFPGFGDLEFAFDAGGMIRGAMNEGKSTPINIRITGKDLAKAHRVAEAIRQEVKQVRGVVDCRILQRLDYPQYIVEVDQAKAADLRLTQTDVMKNLVAAPTPTIQFNKRNFWIDPVSHNQYYVGVQSPEEEIQSIETVLDVPITSRTQNRSIPLRNVATLRRANVPAEITHTNLQP